PYAVVAGRLGTAAIVTDQRPAIGVHVAPTLGGTGAAASATADVRRVLVPAVDVAALHVAGAPVAEVVVAVRVLVALLAGGAEAAGRTAAVHVRLGVVLRAVVAGGEGAGAVVADPAPAVARRMAGVEGRAGGTGTATVHV